MTTASLIVEGKAWFAIRISEAVIESFLFPPFIMVPKGWLYKWLPLPGYLWTAAYHRVWSTTSFLQAFLIPFMWFILEGFGCIDGLHGWNVNKGCWRVRQRKVKKQAPEIVLGNMEQAWYDFN